MVLESKSKLNFSIKVVLITIICIGLNYGGRTLADHLNMPLWLDTFGTVCTAYALGPFCGAVVGATVNVMQGITDPFGFYYGLTSVLIAVCIGYKSRKGIFESYFKTVTWSVVITFVSTALSIPIVLITNDGIINNVWGDACSRFLQDKNLPVVIAVSLGVFYVEFLDKLLVMSIFYIFLRVFRISKNFKKKSFATSILIAVILASVVNPSVGYAEQSDSDNYDKYISTVYNNLNGPPGGTANDIVHTGDGIIWVGTYAGLYRYNGNQFRPMNNFESVKNVNKLFVDEEGRLWIGTNDNGVSVLVNEEIANVLDEKGGLPSNSVRCIAQQSSGLYFIGTSDKLAIVTLTGGFKVVKVIDEIVYAYSLAADSLDHVVAVTDAGSLYVVTDSSVTDTKQKAIDGSNYTSVYCDDKNYVYAGTYDGNIEKYKIVDDVLRLEKKYYCSGLTSVNCLYEKDQSMFVCANNGIGFVDEAGNYHTINTGTFTNNVSNMTEDYQGNLWFASTRLGLLKLCESPFEELYTQYNMEQAVVNTIVKWNDTLYIGTDTGIDTISLSRSANMQLEYELEGIRIRCMRVDSKNNLWICTNGNGVYKVSSDGNYKKFDESSGLLGSKFRCMIELSDGTVAVSGDSGVSILYSENRKDIKTFDMNSGLLNVKTLCLVEGFDGEILAGSDGGGISIIKDNVVTRNITVKDGLNSGVILRIVRDEENKGYYIVTSSGMCYMDNDGRVRALGNIPYNNNYDVYDDGNGTLYVPSSAGIYVINKQKLLAGHKVENDLINTKRGLMIALTANAWNYMDEDGNYYLAGGTGIAKFNIHNFDNSERSYRMTIKSVVVDNVTHYVDKSSDIIINRGANKVVLNPEVINYSSSDPSIAYYLEGFEVEKKVLPQSELGEITYTNLPAGNFRFHIMVLGSDGQTPIEELVYPIVKQEEIFDNGWFKWLFILESAVIVGWFTWFITKTQIQRTIDIQSQKLEFVTKQVKMGNETILAIARTVDAKDTNTSMHSTRVSEYSVLIAKSIGYSDEECEALRKIALLHDIGKIGVPDSVLNKNGRLTDEEYAIMKTHVTKGAEILKDFSLVDHVTDGALYHHERYDGKGYVFGLKGEEIPLNARIIGIADSFDAMTANRVYRKKLPPEVVLEEIMKGRGTQFDPRLVDVFLELLQTKVIDIEKIYGGGETSEEV